MWIYIYYVMLHYYIHIHTNIYTYIYYKVLPFITHVSPTSFKNWYPYSSRMVSTTLWFILKFLPVYIHCMYWKVSCLFIYIFSQDQTNLTYVAQASFKHMSSSMQVLQVCSSLETVCVLAFYLSLKQNSVFPTTIDHFP